MRDSDFKAFDPELLKESDELALNFCEKRDEDGQVEFKLRQELLCYKIWLPWLVAGQWFDEMDDLMQPQSALFKIPKFIEDADEILKELKSVVAERHQADFETKRKQVLKELEICNKSWAKSMNMPHDANIKRGLFVFFVDFKFKPNCPKFMGVKVDDYDKYYRKHPDSFVLFIWAKRVYYKVPGNWKRYTHVVRDPSKYSTRVEKGVTYYVIPDDDLDEIPKPDVPLQNPFPKTWRSGLAAQLKLQERAMSGHYPEKIELTQRDYEKADEIWKKDENAGTHLKNLLRNYRTLWSELEPNELYQGLRNDMKSYKIPKIPRELSRTSLVNPTELRRKAIDRIMDGYVRVLEPKKPHKRLEDVSILGFDTEFHEDRLLSVQLALYSGNGELKSKCIRENLDGYDGKRLLKDCIDFILEYGVRPYTRIFLIAHFAVADVGHLANCLKDFKFREMNRAMHSEFVVPEEPDEKELVAENVELGDFHLKIIDLFAYYQASLAKIGAWIGLPKLDVDRTRILDLYNGDSEKFREYAVRDAEIALKAFVELRDFLWKKYNVELLKSPSIASTAGNIFRINYLEDNNIPARIAYLIDYRAYRTKKGEWSTRRVKEARFAGDIRIRDLALLCYWGGRAECYVHGYMKGKFTLYDVSSLYPSCAMLQPLPNRNTRWVEITLENFTDKGLEGFAFLEFEFPEDTRYPCLPVHGNLHDRLYFPLEGISYCTMSEVREALRLGCRIKQIEGFGFKASESEINHALASFMKAMLKLKMESQKGSVAYENYKLIMNALIGKLAQRNPEDNMDYAQELFTAHGVPMEKAKWGRKIELVGSLWAPEWASLILGRARALMSQFINKGALMTVTDSVLLPKRVNTECEALTELRKVGSDLIAEPYKVESALIVRSKLYALLDAKGEVVKEAHHAVHLSSEQCKEIFQKALQLGCDPDMKGERAHIIRLREALQKGKPLGYAELKPSRIYFRWDWKRELDNPAINMFKEYSDTKPIENVIEHESDYFTIMKRQRASARGRPKEYSAEMVEQIARLKNEGKSYREIARTVNISLGKIQRILKQIFPKNK